VTEEQDSTDEDNTRFRKSTTLTYICLHGK